jgi:hypothetical protein
MPFEHSDRFELRLPPLSRTLVKRKKNRRTNAIAGRTVSPGLLNSKSRFRFCMQIDCCEAPGCFPYLSSIGHTTPRSEKAKRFCIVTTIIFFGYRLVLVERPFDWVADRLSERRVGALPRTCSVSNTGAVSRNRFPG